MKIAPTGKDHVARVTALVAVVFIVQRLVQVADEMNHEFEGLCLRVFVDHSNTFRWRL